MKKIYLILTLITSLSVLSFAQNTYSSFGMRLGLGASTLTGIDGRNNFLPVTPSRDMRGGYRFSWDFGLSYQHGWGQGLLLQADLYAGVQGTKIKGVYSTQYESLRVPVSRFDITNMQLALYMGKKIPLKDNFRIVLAAGPYVGYDFVGGDSYGYEEDGYYDGYGEDYGAAKRLKAATGYQSGMESSPTKLDSDDMDFRRFDFGLMALAGVEFGRLQIAFNPQFGLTNLDFKLPRVSHRVFKVGFTYYF